MSPVVLLELVRIAIDIRGGFKGRYWQWRMNTAIGGEASVKSPHETRAAAIEFARWRRSMRRMCHD